MTIEIRVPQLPESVSDASIAAWVFKQGDYVNIEDNLLELETDKVVLEVPAPASGVLVEIKAQQGDTVLGGDVIGIIDETVSDETATSSTETTNNSTSASIPVSASPSVRKTLAENELSGFDIQGSGKHGRILKEDVKEHLQTQASSVTNTPDSTSRTPASKPANAQAEDSQISDTEGRIERRVPMTRLRARIAERLLEAQQTAAILTTFNEVDLSEVARLRRKYQERFQKSHGIKLGFMSFFVKAATEALKRYPEVNARIDDGDIIYQGYYDIGIAVSSDRGLVVPILRNTDSMGNADIEKAISDYAGRARSGHLELDELIGGTFSITNGGIFGSMLSTPIINPPQSAILGMHKIQERPVAIDGEVVVRPMMYLALSYDHRLIDGQAAVSFLVKMKELLEDPASLFLEL
ncbi:MAG TPA: 2-oxoglutarate dehydrogenase complex dihydrolipoyllysine-residue succinyltransferase [Leucothrix sp.]|nr:2-oxoglutarate dehydrogenase complex dihydrolipoyllysine-residue succinyltransferase [Leucothrix sp.]